VIVLSEGKKILMKAAWVDLIRVRQPVISYGQPLKGLPFPLLYPIRYDAAIFGGMLTGMCIWSGCAVFVMSYIFIPSLYILFFR